jgi:hypothetical protein
VQWGPLAEACLQFSSAHGVASSGKTTARDGGNAGNAWSNCQ